MPEGSRHVLDQPLSSVRPYPPVSTGAPTLTGTAEVGRMLTARRGTWSTDRPISEYGYLCLRCDAGGANRHALLPAGS